LLSNFNLFSSAKVQLFFELAIPIVIILDPTKILVKMFCHVVNNNYLCSAKMLSVKSKNIKKMLSVKSKNIKKMLSIKSKINL